MLRQLYFFSYDVLYTFVDAFHELPYGAKPPVNVCSNTTIAQQKECQNRVDMPKYDVNTLTL